MLVVSIQWASTLSWRIADLSCNEKQAIKAGSSGNDAWIYVIRSVGSAQGGVISPVLMNVCSLVWNKAIEKGCHRKAATLKSQS